MNFIYALSCPDTGEIRYVGQTSRGTKRFTEHAKGMKCSDGSIYKKYWVQQLLDTGKIFDSHILTTLPDASQLDTAEIYWIAFLKSRGHRLTNLTDGGGGVRGRRHSDEEKAKISAAHLGKKLTAEHRKKLSEAHMGKSLSIEHRAKLSAALSKSRPRRSDETRRRLSVANGGRPFVDQNGNLYRTQGEAARRLDLQPSKIGMVLRGLRMQTGGYSFMYSE